MPPTLEQGGTLAALSCIGNGSAVVFWRLKSVQDSGVSVVVFNTYATLAGALIMLLVGAAHGLTPSFDGPSMLGGTLAAASGLCALLAVKWQGVGASEPLWSSAATCTSFFWGKLVFGEPMGTLWRSALGLVLILVGMAIIVHVRLNMLSEPPESTMEDRALLTGAGVHSRRPGLDSLLDGRIRGVLLAVLAGVLGGSVFVPQHYVEKGQQGLPYAVTFSVGTAIVQMIVCTAFLATNPVHLSRLEARATLLPGIGQGAVFAFTNVCTIVAALSPLGLARAQPARECGLIVGIMWGALVFKEIHGRALLALCLAGLTIVLGMLALGGEHK